MAKILLVDDNVELLKMQCIVLRRAGHDVTTAISGCEALWETKQNTFDLVITDIVMAEMDGLEFITTLRHRAPDLKIIATTGGRSYGLELAKNLGIAQTLTKPVSGRHLLETIDAVLNVKSQPNAVDKTP